MRGQLTRKEPVELARAKVHVHEDGTAEGNPANMPATLDPNVFGPESKRR
jgi:hypothetical protein